MMTTLLYRAIAASVIALALGAPARAQFGGPSAPTNLVAAVVGSTLTLAWNGSPGATSYRIEAGNFSGTTDVAAVDVSTTSVTTNRLMHGRYFLRVRAVASGVAGAPSNEVTVAMGCSEAPAAPYYFSSRVVGNTVTFSWTDPYGGCAATDYSLIAGSAPGMSNLARLRIPACGFDCQYSVLAPDGQYYVRLVATNQYGVSEPSFEMLVRVPFHMPLPLPPAPFPPIPIPPTPPPAADTIPPGQHLVPDAVKAGRYFTDPATSCYWERQSGLRGTLEDVIANAHIGFDASQWIVDIAETDVAFDTKTECATWTKIPRQRPLGPITPGVWLVGTQIAAGQYRATTSVGCYWERLSDFSGENSGIIANDFVSTAGVRTIEIEATDAGFRTDGACGTWTKVPGT